MDKKKDKNIVIWICFFLSIGGLLYFICTKNPLFQIFFFLLIVGIILELYFPDFLNKVFPLIARGFIVSISILVSWNAINKFIQKDIIGFSAYLLLFSLLCFILIILNILSRNEITPIRKNIILIFHLILISFYLGLFNKSIPKVLKNTLFSDNLYSIFISFVILVAITSMYISFNLDEFKKRKFIGIYLLILFMFLSFPYIIVTKDLPITNPTINFQGITCSPNLNENELFNETVNCKSINQTGELILIDRNENITIFNLNNETNTLVRIPEIPEKYNFSYNNTSLRFNVLSYEQYFEYEQKLKEKEEQRKENLWKITWASITLMFVALACVFTNEDKIYRAVTRNSETKSENQTNEINKCLEKIEKGVEEKNKKIKESEELKNKIIKKLREIVKKLEK
ncbi:MAG: hypothetical protein ACOCXG_04890 [Nanoarchaeota archaeon]